MAGKCKLLILCGHPKLREDHELEGRKDARGPRRVDAPPEQMKRFRLQCWSALLAMLHGGRTKTGHGNRNYR
jgi:hypothetical protein